MRPTIRSYRDLVVWQRAVDLVVEVYQLSRRFPTSERFGLTSQVRRAAISVPANIAEGHKRGSRRQYEHFVAIARGSGAELETEITIALRLGLIDSVQAENTLHLCDQVGRMLTRLHERLRAGM